MECGEVATKRLPRILHVGCGNHPIPSWFLNEATLSCGFEEWRLDIDPNVYADYHRPVTDMGEIGQFEFVYSCHTFEHIYRHDLEKAFSECLRVLVPGGMLITVVPDVEDIKPTDEVVYESTSGPITGLDMYFGMGRCVQANPYMEHHTAFTSDTMRRWYERTGFRDVRTMRGMGWNLVGLGVK